MSFIFPQLVVKGELFQYVALGKCGTRRADLTFSALYQFCLGIDAEMIMNMFTIS